MAVKWESVSIVIEVIINDVLCAVIGYLGFESCFQYLFLFFYSPTIVSLSKFPPGKSRLRMFVILLSNSVVSVSFLQFCVAFSPKNSDTFSCSIIV